MANLRCASWLLLCSVLLISGSGCGSGVDRPDLGFVSGTVTMDGKPVGNIIVVMKPEKGRPAMVRTNKEGFYDIEYTQDEKGTKTGPTKVSLEWPLGEAGEFAVPAAYVGEATTLNLDVKPGKQPFDIKMVKGAAEAQPAAGGKRPMKKLPPVD